MGGFPVGHGGEDAAAELRVKPRLSLLAFAQSFGAEGLDDGLPLRLGLRVACDGFAIRFHDNSVAHWKFGSLEAWKFGFLGGAPPHTPAEKVWKLGGLEVWLCWWGSAPHPSGGSLEAWLLHEDTKERKGLGTRGGLRRPGERKTENREQRARGKRAMGKALYRAVSAAVLFLLPHRLRAVFSWESDKARNGGRRARSAAEPQSDRWSPKRFARPVASLRFGGELFLGRGGGIKLGY